MMDCSVRFVYETTLKDGRTIQVAGIKPALCFRGSKHALAVINDESWIRTIEIDLHDHDKAGYVKYHGEPYEPKPFADRLLMAAKAASKPVTRRAKHLLTVLEKADETNLPPEILERSDEPQERVYADNTPKEKQKAAERPGPIKDLTEEYKAREAAAELSDDMLALKKAAKKPAKRVEATKPEVIKVPVKVPPAKVKVKPAPGKPAAERGTLIKKLAAEYKMEPFDLRVLIRSTGMRAPYEDEAKVRAAIKKAKSALISVGAERKTRDYRKKK